MTRIVVPLLLLLVLPASVSGQPAKKSSSLPPGVKQLVDLEYVPDGHARQKLDLYLPENPPGPLPVIVWIHGGGWQNGDKANTPAIPLTAKGYAVASINYRFSQHAIFPAQIHDCKAAIRWLRANAATHGLNPDRMGVWGSSAGGHLAALLGTTGDQNELEGDLGNPEQSSRVQAAVDWFGPTDFLTAGAKSTRSNLLGGDAQEHPEKARAASPMTYVSKSAAPFLIMHGDQDTTVPLEQSTTFAKALQQSGAEARCVIVEGAKHGVTQFRRPENLRHVEEFLARHLQTK